MDFERRAQLRARIRAIVEPTVERLGCDLVAVELSGERGRAVLRLVIDRPGGVGIDDCTRVSRAVSPELDVEDPMPGPYSLEVSSPGMERPVERPEDFARFAGHRIRVRMAPGEDRRRWSGVLRGWRDGFVLVEVDGELHRLPADRVDRARLVLTPDEYRRLGEAIPEPGEDAP